MPSSSRWDAKAVLKLSEPLQCRADTKHGSACKNGIKTKTAKINHYLARLSRQQPDPDALRPDLLALAPYTLCNQELHQAQAEERVDQWEKDIDAAFPGGETGVSCGQSTVSLTSSGILDALGSELLSMNIGSTNQNSSASWTSSTPTSYNDNPPLQSTPPQKAQRRLIDGDCLFCLEPMDTTWCQTCGNSMHGSCADTWVKESVDHSGYATCPMCRATWKASE